MLRSVNFAKLSMAQLEVLHQIGIAEHIGEHGVDALEGILYRNALDVATAARRVNEIVTAINAGIEWAKQIREQLSRIIHVAPVREPEGTVLLRIHFSGDAHMSNIAEFKEWGETWYLIARGITMAHDQAPEDLRIVGAGKGSIILEVSAGYLIAKTASSIIRMGLEVAERVVQIRMEAQRVRSLKIANDAAERAYKELEQAATDERSAGTAKIAKDAIKEIGLKKDKDAEKIAALKRSIAELMEFVERGGQIDFVLTKDNDEAEPEDADAERDRAERVELWERFEEIRKLEQRVKQIEHFGGPEQHEA